MRSLFDFSSHCKLDLFLGHYSNFFLQLKVFFKAPILKVKNQPISVERTKDKVKISTEGTLIELEQIQNANGERIKILGLPAHSFPGLPYLDHTQYKTVILLHNSETENFNFSGTNGYTAKIDASSNSTE